MKSETLDAKSENHESSQQASTHELTHAIQNLIHQLRVGGPLSSAQEPNLPVK